jgi:hypothetical protein
MKKRPVCAATALAVLAAFALSGCEVFPDPEQPGFTYVAGTFQTNPGLFITGYSGQATPAI